MRRRLFLGLLGRALLGQTVLGVAAGTAAAAEFMALVTAPLRGDAQRLGWSSLRAGFRVQFPAAASGRAFMQRRYDVLDAVERELGRARYDPDGGASERERLARLIADTVRRIAPRGTVSRVYDIWIEAR